MAALSEPRRTDGSTVGPMTVIIVAGCILSLSMGLRQCLGLFLPPIRADIGISAFACDFQLIFITAYLLQYLAICGVSPATSASALGLIGLGNAVGSYVIGRLGARFSPKRLLSAIYLLRTAVIAAFLVTPVSSASVYAFATCMGLLWLGVVPLVSGLIGGMFGMRYFNTLFGLVFLSHQVGSGAWLGGLTFDLTGSLHAAWSAMIVIGLSAGTLQWFMDDRAEPAAGLLREQAA